jgi:hypothetical protein
VPEALNVLHCRIGPPVTDTVDHGDPWVVTIYPNLNRAK